MTPELAFQLADIPGRALSEKLQVALDFYVQNNGDSIGFPYASVDIAFQGFLEDADLSTREQDMIYIAHFFHQAYKTLHITIRSMKEIPSPAAHKTLEKVYLCMKKYNLQHRLLKDIEETEFMKY